MRRRAVNSEIRIEVSACVSALLCGYTTFDYFQLPDADGCIARLRPTEREPRVNGCLQ